jgi:TetR/AcrR family transcriptional regulator, upper aerobic nicotinate degradation pathway regulator
VSAATAKRALVEPGSRDRIDQVAVRLFARYGYDGVSLQRIANEVGLHKSTLFHHYGSKLEILDSVLDVVVDSVLACIQPLLEQPKPELETLLEVIDALVDLFSDNPDAAGLLVSVTVAPDDSEVRTAGSAERAMAFYGGVASWLERARRFGVVRKLSIRQAIPNLMGLVLFYPALADELADLVGPEPFSPRAREVRKAELRVLLSGMLAPRP